MNTLQQVCQALHDSGGRPYLVGGCVRDEILGVTPKDYDVEVFNLSPALLKSTLEKFGPVNAVGQSFGVLKLRVAEGEVDFSTPRRDNKAGDRHTDFTCELVPDMPIWEAASRRDFTINAIYKDVVSGKLEDPHKGIEHLKRGLLWAVSEHYQEDPLRVLRGMQLASRFNLRMLENGNTSHWSAWMFDQYSYLPLERVGEEWRKWTKGSYPSNGLKLLEDTTWLWLYTELTDLRWTQQAPEHHPEGNVWVHTMYVCDAMAAVCDRENIHGENREVLMFAALCHDLGKPATTVFERGKWRSPGHAQVGVPIAERFLKSIGIYDRVIQRVLPLVSEHMYDCWNKQTRRTIRRLKIRLGQATIDELLLVMEADLSGRPPFPACKPDNYDQIKELAADLPPTIEPLINGRDIIDMCPGIDGKTIGRVKAELFECQLNEDFFTKAEGLEMLKILLIKVQGENNGCSN